MRVAVRYRFAGAIAIGVAVLIVVALVWRSGESPALPAPVVVAADPGAADAARIAGATPRERDAARAALALIGPDARFLRLRYSDCPRGTRGCHAGFARQLVLVTAALRARGTPPQLAGFLGALAARDAAERLYDSGERLAWHVDPDIDMNGPQGLGRPRASIDLTGLRSQARTIAERARAAGWNVGVELYATPGGAMVVTVRFGDRSLLATRDTAFFSTLFGRGFRPRVWHTLLLIDGPGRVFEGGGGAGMGATYGARGTSTAPVPSWLAHARTDIRISVHQGDGTRRFRVTCGGPGHASPTATCRRMLGERAVLFSPVESDSSCAGGLGDGSSVAGTVGGIRLEHSFSGCYGGVVDAWESLLHVASPG